MIKTYYQNYIVNCIAAIITYGLNEGYSSVSIEEHIVSSLFINKLENNEYDIESKMENIVESTYNTSLIKPVDISFKGLFLAESYFKLFVNFNKSFEYIFLYLPLDYLLDKYDIYHEMDFSNLKNDFIKQTNESTIIKKLSKKRQIKLKEISKLTGLNANTINKYCRNNNFIYSASFNNIYKLSKLFAVKENLFIENLGVYLDSSIYLFDKSNDDFRNYLGLYYANYFDNRIDENNFKYEKNKNCFFSKNGIKLIVISSNLDDINIDKINEKTNSKTYLVLIPYSFFGNKSQFEFLKEASALEIFILAQEYVYFVKKNIQKEITDTISRSLISRAKEKVVFKI